MSSVPVSYQIVGTYGYFPFGHENSPLKEPLEGLNIGESTIEDILRAVVNQVNKNPDNPNALGIVFKDGVTASVLYRFKNGVSIKPINAKAAPSNGYRDISAKTYKQVTANGEDDNVFNGVIQYYRSVTVSPKDDPTTQYTIKLRSEGQPLVSKTNFFDSLADFPTAAHAQKFFEAFNIISYNIVQRTILIDLKPESTSFLKYQDISNLLEGKTEQIQTSIENGEPILQLAEL